MAAIVVAEAAFEQGAGISPIKSQSGIAFEVTHQFKSPERAKAHTKVRVRLEGRSKDLPTRTGSNDRCAQEGPLPHLLSRARAAKLHVENEAKKQTAERVGTEQAERLRRLGEGIGEKVCHAAEKRREVLATISQRASKHLEAVTHRGRTAEECKAGEAAAMRLKLSEDMKQKGTLHEASVNARRVTASEHNKAVEDKVKKAQEVEEHRKEELKAKLEKKTGSKVSGKVFDAQEGAEN